MKTLSFETIKNRYTKIAPMLNEKTRRCWAAVDAEELGYGGIVAVSRATGLTPRTIRDGIKELSNGASLDNGKQRKAGGGRKKLVKKQPTILVALKKFVGPYTSGDPIKPLRWT